MGHNDKKQANNIFSIEFWRQREMDLYVGKLLRYGVFTACFITVLGGIIYVFQSHGMPDYKPVSGHHDQFEGVVPYLRELNTIIPALLRFDGAAIIQLGVVVLIATPIIRVAFSAIVFLIERDYLYVAVTLIVLAVILLNMIFGLH
ncbi:MAG: hypothetical protein H6Q14_2673 [Bacteroidetes bacterium]|jgi:uncharacterized membrane protein|nr:hypothetical protein [Bacteroidota bacterium]